jgi:hypothetical protein
MRTCASLNTGGLVALACSAALFATAAAQTAPAQMPAAFTLKLTPMQIGQLGAAIQFLPKNQADPLIIEIDRQLAEQQKAPEKPAEEKKPDEKK